MANILVVDDEPMARQVMRLGLEREGHTVVDAEDGMDALVIISDTSVDVVVTDIYMPRMNGSELISIIRREYPNLKVIAVSGRPVSFVAQDGSSDSENGIPDRTVSKPFSLGKLNQVVTEVLELDLT